MKLHLVKSLPGFWEKTLVGVGWAVSLLLCRNDFRNEISLLQKPSVLKMETPLCEKTAF